MKNRMKKLSELIFVDHSFMGSFLILLCFGLPWWIAYWPGTLQYDSCGQLLQYLGVGRMTGHHPLPVTMLMGILLDVGRVLFHSDNAGIFLYTGIQFLAQCLVISYGFSVFNRIGVPIWMRWLSLVFYALFPLFPNWGISFCKDTGYYISFMLFVLVIIDAFLREDGQAGRLQRTLWVLSLFGVASFRNDGRYVIIITIVVLLLFVRKHWKTYLEGLGMAVLFLVLVEHVYMPIRNIPAGAVREAMSVPLMQTANYLGQYGEEVTEEEETVLAALFAEGDLRGVAEAYDEEISDNVKGRFKEYPDRQELFAYFKVWWGQFKKHPGIYVETFWRHCDGYFDPFRKCYDDIIGCFKILDGQSRSDEYLDIYFGIEDQHFRDMLEDWAYFLYKLPVFRLLYRPAVYTWVMAGCLLFLLRKKRKETLVILPGIVVLLICMVSPLNASVRYFLPVMAVLPIYLGICGGLLCCTKEEDGK